MCAIVEGPSIWILICFVGFGWCLLVFRMLLHVHVHGFCLFKGLIRENQTFPKARKWKIIVSPFSNDPGWLEQRICMGSLRILVVRW